MSRTFRLGTLLLILSAISIYSGSAFFTKLASRCEALDVTFWAYFSGLLLCMGVYAIMWQKILSVIPLNKAYFFKSLTIVLGLLISHFAFGESITSSNCIGAGLILAGLVNLTFDS